MWGIFQSLILPCTCEHFVYCICLMYLFGMKIEHLVISVYGKSTYRRYHLCASQKSLLMFIWFVYCASFTILRDDCKFFSKIKIFHLLAIKCYVDVCKTEKKMIIALKIEFPICNITYIEFKINWDYWTCSLCLHIVLPVWIATT